MNWRTSFAASVAVSLLAVSAVSAAEPAGQKTDAQPTAAQSADKAKAKDSAKKNRKCATTAASRIRRDTADCEQSSPGQRVYTSEEIATAGEMDVSEALRKIDPRIQ